MFIVTNTITTSDWAPSYAVIEITPKQAQHYLALIERVQALKKEIRNLYAITVWDSTPIFCELENHMADALTINDTYTDSVLDSGSLAMTREVVTPAEPVTLDVVQAHVEACGLYWEGTWGSELVSTQSIPIALLERIAVEVAE